MCPRALSVAVSSRADVAGHAIQLQCCRAQSYLEVFWKEQFAGPEETQNVAEYLAVPIYEVVLLQAVQHDGLGAIEQATDSEN